MFQLLDTVIDTLKAGKEAKAAYDELTDDDGKDPELDPLAKAVLEVFHDFKVKEPWLTEDVMVEGLEALAAVLKAKHAEAQSQ